MGAGGWRTATALGVAMIAIAAGASGPAGAGSATSTQPPITAALTSGQASVETVIFGDQPGSSVRVVRGMARATPPQSSPILPRRTEIVSFGTGFAEEVKVIRGGAAVPAVFLGQSGGTNPRIQRVSFGNSALPAVTVVRGDETEPGLVANNLFGPADIGQLDLMAFAVDGIESRHGADLRMWRSEVSGPQGPMQVSAAAAFDVGGGDRFDIDRNRQLGRAYLAEMFRRYGNWPDALAAYNWGPGNVDLWITGGRDQGRLPPGVAWYVGRALRDARAASALKW
jgi:transglycosylase-like protein with SLT domain